MSVPKRPMLRRGLQSRNEDYIHGLFYSLHYSYPLAIPFLHVYEKG